jgi:hypothetical protein
VVDDAIEEIAACDHAVFHHFVEAGPKLAARQGAQQRRIDNHDGRLVERANQILAERVIDADLAADRAVHLRQQRRGHVDEGDAAEIGGRGKACGVTDNASADGDDGAASVRARADQRLVDARDRLQVLVPLAVRNQNRLRAVEGRPEPLAVEPPDDGAGDDEATSADLLRVEDFRETVSDAVADQDRRCARCRAHVYAYG